MSPESKCFMFCIINSLQDLRKVILEDDLGKEVLKIYDETGKVQPTHRFIISRLASTALLGITKE